MVKPRPRFWAMRRMRLRNQQPRRLPPVSVLPTLCTLGNLIAGFAAIHYAAREPSVHLLWRDWTPLTFAAMLVFLGMLLDAVDGAVARLTRSSSELGAQLDSLADVVTFGVAPAFMVLRLVANHFSTESNVIGPEADSVLGKVIWAAAAVYVSCTALRLARYNVESGTDVINENKSFRGLPSPGAAGTVASLVLLHQHLLLDRYGIDSAGFAKAATLGMPVIMLLCGFAMVSRIPYVHFANRYISGRRSFAYVVRLAVVLAAAVWWFREAMVLAFTAYALSGPVRLIWLRLRQRRQ